MIPIKCLIVATTLAVVMLSVLSEAVAKSEANEIRLDDNAKTLEAGRQLQLLLLGKSKETSTPNFVRLVVMRLIYGLASRMGIEDQLEDTFNGAFVPPNADEGLGLGDFGAEDGDGDGLLGGIFGGDDIL